MAEATRSRAVPQELEEEGQKLQKESVPSKESGRGRHAQLPNTASARTRRNSSPYLSEPNRLADVIAAIQAMGIYKFYKLPFEGWADHISGDRSGISDGHTSAEHWRRVFEEHPEFFRLDGKREKASLVWRRQYPKSYHVDKREELSQADLYALSPKEREERVSRVPLTPQDIQTLIATATNLHARALEAKQDKRWWIPWIGPFSALIGVILGVILKVILDPSSAP